MALTYSKEPQMGSLAPDFRLPGVDGRDYSLSQFQGKKALVLIFMCNHCPYVIAVRDRINQLAKDFGSRGVQVIGISANDASNYPQDSFEKMKELSESEGFVFPYLYDETQETARAYEAVCTPDPYVYEVEDGKFLLRYHGQIDDNWKEGAAVRERPLAAALEAILTGQEVSADQKPAMGCSIKWKS